MDRKKEGISYGFVLAGLTGCFWAYSELRNSNIDNSFIKANLKHPLSFQEENEGKLVYVSGMLYPTYPTPLKDYIFGISVPGLALRRKVEMLQYSLTKESTVQQIWSNIPISNTGLPVNYENPKWKIHDLDMSTKGPLKIHEYKLDSKILKNIKS